MMRRIAVFGPARDDEQAILEALKKHLDPVERPILLVSSTTRGWDRAAMMYADRNKNVFHLPIKADQSEGWEIGCKKCNGWIESVVMEGITRRGLPEKFKISTDMVKKLEASGKPVTYLEIQREKKGITDGS